MTQNHAERSVPVRVRPSAVKSRLPNVIWIFSVSESVTVSSEKFSRGEEQMSGEQTVLSASID